ncbi:hypothetical protein YC2023_063664 [Brassica napus]
MRSFGDSKAYHDEEHGRIYHPTQRIGFSLIFLMWVSSKWANKAQTTLTTSRQKVGPVGFLKSKSNRVHSYTSKTHRHFLYRLAITTVLHYSLEHSIFLLPTNSQLTKSLKRINVHRSTDNTTSKCTKPSHAPRRSRLLTSISTLLHMGEDNKKAVVGVLQQSFKPLQTAPNRSEPHKFKSWFQLAFALTSHKYPANAPIFNRRTSRTNLLKPLETATTRIRKLPQPQPQPLRLNQSGPKSDYSSKIRNLLFENKIDTEDQNIDIINESQLLLNHTKKFAF